LFLGKIENLSRLISRKFTHQSTNPGANTDLTCHYVIGNRPLISLSGQDVLILFNGDSHRLFTLYIYIITVEKI